jgi:glucose dehydrogenase
MRIKPMEILGTMVPGEQTGSINFGGPMITAGGLVFTSAGMDPNLHAFDSDTGKELWKYELPAAAQATPMTYTLICRAPHPPQISQGCAPSLG